MSRTRVLLVVDRLASCGATDLVRQLAVHLPRARFETHVWAVRSQAESEIDGEREAEGARRLAALGIPSATIALDPARALPRRLTPLVRALRGGAFDVVHAHSRPADFWCALAGALAGVPVRLYSRQATYGGMGRGVRLRYALAARLCARVIAVSEAVRQHLVTRELAPAARVALVYDGIDLAALDAAAPGAVTRARLGVAPDAPLVGVVAALTPRKGQRFLLDAAPRILARHPETRFLLIGEGPERARLEAQARITGCAGAFLFLGQRADCVDLVAALDVFVLPSLWEGLNLSLLTACALGRAVVASNVGSNREIVRHGETGLLPTPACHALEASALDPAALAESVNALLSAPALRARLGAAARADVRARFDARDMAARHAALYEALRSDRRAGRRAQPVAGSALGEGAA